MIDFQKIKLIIWDLDETLWEGTLSDNDSLKPRSVFVQFINDSLDRGVIHSICSKNNFQPVKDYMNSLNLWNLFVFASISWDPKGKRIKAIIDDMKLRSENVLFVDDNHSNLNEALYYCPELQVCTPQQLEESVHLIYEITKVDKLRPRLEQYRLLEEKQKNREGFSSNDEFLMSCNIRVNFHQDCIENIDRIHDLIMRSNQLNYTKFRQSKELLYADLMQPGTKAEYITVCDSYGDYGIVGFYMIVEGKVKHYLFSCRTLGMLVEQYVYVVIGCPAFTVVGDVITSLNDTDVPAWINQKDATQKVCQDKADTGGHKVLFKGPCDISQIFSFIKESDDVVTEFTYVNDAGISVEGYNHTAQIVTALTASTEDKNKLIAETPWLDAEMLNAFSWQENDAIVFSLLTDGNLGIYQHKDTGHQIALCEKYYDLTDSNNWDDYINKRIFTSCIDFKESELIEFSEKYEYIDNLNGDITIHNLDVLYKYKRKDAKLILLLGSEKAFKGSTTSSYLNRHLFHKKLNDQIKIWAEGKKDVYLIEITQYIETQKDYTNTINHFQKRVYYKIAQEILRILDTDHQSLKIKGKSFLYFISAKKNIKNFLKKILGKS